MRGSDELGQLRDDLVQVADDAEVGVLEDRRVRVLVDRDDQARALHPDLVLDRAGDADRDVELRRDGLAGLADLRRVRVPARVDDRARRGDRAAERLGELLDEREALRPAEAAAAGDDHVGVLDRRPLALLVGLLDHRRRQREVLQARLELLDLRAAAALLRLERARADEREARLGAPADVDVDRVAERRALADELAVLDRRDPSGPSSGPRRAARRGRRRRRPRARSPRTGRRRSRPRRRASRARRRAAAAAACRAATSSITWTRCAPKRPASAARPSTPEPSSTASASPSAAALPSTPSESFCSLPSWCSRKTRDFIGAFFSARNSTIFSAAEPSSSIFCDVAAGGRVVQRHDGRARAGLAGLLGRHAEVGERERLLRLLLRAHDPLQRRVARLVDRVRDGDHGGQRRLDHVVAELGLALAARLAVLDARARPPARSAAAAAGRRRRPRARRRRRRWPAGRRARGRRPRARAPPRARGSSRRGRSRRRPRRRRARRGRRPSPAPCASPRAPSPGRARRSRPRPRRSASFSFSASSTAFASKGFSAPSPERSSRFVDGSIRRAAVASGTYLTQTAIFIARRDSTEGGSARVRPFEHDRSP